MKVIKRIVNVLDRVTDTGALVFFILMLLVGIYSIYDSYMLYKKATDDSILKYKPGYGSDEDDARNILPSMVAWLTINDTKIDYPIMQGKDNIEFLNKDPFGDYSLSGSIFLDFRNKKDFSDSYNLIYGHHMEGGGMFGVLDGYVMKKDYLKKHSKGSLIVGKKIYDLTLFAVLHADATDREIFSPADSEDVLSYIIKNAEILDKNTLENKKTDKLIALSTCRYPDTTERTVVVGFLKIKNTEETESEFVSVGI